MTISNQQPRKLLPWAFLFLPLAAIIVILCLFFSLSTQREENLALMRTWFCVDSEDDIATLSPYTGGNSTSEYRFYHDRYEYAEKDPLRWGNSAGEYKAELTGETTYRITLGNRDILDFAVKENQKIYGIVVNGELVDAAIVKNHNKDGSRFCVGFIR